MYILRSFVFLAWFSSIYFTHANIHDKAPAEVSQMAFKKKVLISKATNEMIEGASPGHKGHEFPIAALGKEAANPISNFYHAIAENGEDWSGQIFGRGCVYIHPYHLGGFGDKEFRSEDPENAFVSIDGGTIRTGLMVSGLGEKFIPNFSEGMRAAAHKYPGVATYISVSSQGLPWTAEQMKTVILRPQYALDVDGPYAQKKYNKGFKTKVALFSADGAQGLHIPAVSGSKRRKGHASQTVRDGAEMSMGFSTHTGGAQNMIILSGNAPIVTGIPLGGTALWSQTVLLGEGEVPVAQYFNLHLLLNDAQARKMSHLARLAPNMDALIKQMEEDVDFKGTHSLRELKNLFDVSRGKESKGKTAAELAAERRARVARRAAEAIKAKEKAATPPKSELETETKPKTAEKIAAEKAKKLVEKARHDLAKLEAQKAGAEKNVRTNRRAGASLAQMSKLSAIVLEKAKEVEAQKAHVAFLEKRERVARRHAAAERKVKP